MDQNADPPDRPSQERVDELIPKIFAAISATSVGYLNSEVALASVFATCRVLAASCRRGQAVTTITTGSQIMADVARTFEATMAAQRAEQGTCH